MKRIYSIIAFCIITSTAFCQGSGKCLSFNGTSSFSNCGSINLRGTDLTLMCWVKPNSFKSISSIIGTEVSGNMALIRLGGTGQAIDRAQFALLINGGQRYLNSNKPLSANKWYHIAATYDGTTMKIYINGQLDVSRAQTGSISSNTIFYIGRNRSNTRILDGEIDEVSVWKTALSQATIRDYMCKSITSNHPDYSNLEGYWKFDETSGNTSTDHSGNNHTATLVNNPGRINSAAPIGNASAHDFSAPFSLKLAHPDGDSIVVNNVSGSPGSVHVYRVDSMIPNSTNGISGLVTKLDSIRYWGVYLAEDTSADASVTYYYSKNKNVLSTKGSCIFEWSERDNNADSTWQLANATRTPTTLLKTKAKTSEYILGLSGSSAIHHLTTDTICQGDSILLKYPSNSLTYSWLRNGMPISGNNLDTLYAKKSGVYQVVITHNNNCSDTSLPFALVTNTVPNVSFPPLAPVCISQTFDTISGGLPLGGTYLSPYMSGNLFVVNTAGPGNHKIVYQYTKGICSDTASQILKVNPLPNVSLPSFSNVCADSSAFTLNTGSPVGGSYKVNGIPMTQFSATVQGAGLHLVSYTFTDNNNCTDSSSQTINVVPLPTVTFKLPRRHFCEDADAFALDGASPNGGTFSGTGVTNFNYSPKAAGAGSHIISYNYTDRNTGCKNVAQDTVTIMALPPAPTITKNGSRLSVPTADGYQWYDKNGEIIGETKQHYTPLKPGTYRASITVAGCTSPISNGFDFSVLNISDNNPLLAQIQSYPNPFKNRLTIKGKRINQIQILDMQGKVLINENTDTSNSVQVNTDKLSKGSYLLVVTFFDGNKSRKVIMKSDF